MTRVRFLVRIHMSRVHINFTNATWRVSSVGARVTVYIITLAFVLWGSLLGVKGQNIALT